jgi:WD40 repeat protein
LLDGATGKLLWLKRDIGYIHQVSVAFSPDGKTVCAGVAGAGATLIDSRTGEAKRRLEANGVTAVVFSPDGKQVAAACQDARGRDKGGHEARLWDAETGKLLRALPDASGAIAFSPDGKMLATARNDAAVCLWDVKTGDLKKAVKGKPASLLVFSPDGKTLAAVEGRAGPLSLFDVEKGEKLRAWQNDGVDAAAFSADGKSITTWTRSAGANVLKGVGK